MPHRENTNKFGRFCGIFLVILFSVLLVFFLQKYQEKSRAKEEVQKNEKMDLYAKKTVQESEIKGEQKNLEAILFAENEAKKIELEKKAVRELEIPKVSAERSKDPKNRLQEAKLYAKPQILEGKYIDISLAHQNMVLFENGKAIEAFLISSGKRGMETPQGTFKIENKTPRAWSKTYSLWMPNWMAILPSGKVGIHELPVWPGGYQEGAKHLGIPVSHGCVRLGPGSAKFVYDWVDLGTPVIVHK